MLETIHCLPIVFFGLNPTGDMMVGLPLSYRNTPSFLWLTRGNGKWRYETIASIFPSSFLWPTRDKSKRRDQKMFRSLPRQSIDSSRKEHSDNNKPLFLWPLSNGGLSITSLSLSLLFSPPSSLCCARLFSPAFIPLSFTFLFHFLHSEL